MTTRKAVLVLVLLVVGVALTFAGGAKEGAGQVKNIAWQVWITPNLTRAHYQEVIQAFEKQNPDIKVAIVETTVAGGGSADDFLKTRLAAGDVPDLWSNVGVLSAFADAGHLWPLPANDPDLKRVRNINAYKYKGTLYSFQRQVQPLGMVFYNKKLWGEAGLTSTPRSWAELEAAGEKIKQAGLTPIITGAGFAAGLTFTAFVQAEIHRKDPQWYTDRWAGKVHFTDDDWVEATAFFKRLVDKGYFNPGALSLEYSDMEQQFLSGRAVMYPMGSWFSAAEAAATKDFEVSVFLQPTKTGAAHLLQVLNYGEWAVYAKSKYAKEAYKLIKFYIMDPVYGAKALQADGLYSNLQPPLTYPMTPLQKAIMDLIPAAKTTSGQYDTNVGVAPPAGVADAYNSFGEQMLAGRVTDVKEALKQLDEFWDKAPRP
jgi:ABC-type glycerol-3-phosphate transport system substrate-binding protein